MPMPGSSRKKCRRPSRTVRRFANASRTLSATRPTACGFWTCGISSVVRSKRRACRRAKTSAWKSRSAFSPTPRRSTARRSMPLICSMRAMHRRPRPCGRRRSTWKSWLGTSRSFRKRRRHSSRRGSASRMWAQPCVIMRAGFTRPRSGWRNSKSGWRCWIG